MSVQELSSKLYLDISTLSSMLKDVYYIFCTDDELMDGEDVIRDCPYDYLNTDDYYTKYYVMSIDKGMALLIELENGNTVEMDLNDLGTDCLLMVGSGLN